MICLSLTFAFIGISHICKGHALFCAIVAYPGTALGLFVHEPHAFIAAYRANVCAQVCRILGDIAVARNIHTGKSADISAVTQQLQLLCPVIGTDMPQYMNGHMLTCVGAGMKCTQ